MKPVVAGDAALVCKEAVPDRTEPLPADPPIYESREIGEILRRKAKRVVTFLGFGELGYEDEARMRDIARGEMERHAPERTIVNTSTLITNGFRHGIADVYGIAKWRGFETTGIHSSVCLQSRDRHTRSAFVDEVLFVRDGTWGGWLDAIGTPSPTLLTLVEVSDEVVAIGGGKHTAEELLEFCRRGRPVRFHAADMSHRISVAWAQRQGLEIANFRGAAHDAWLAICQDCAGRCGA